ncbi:protein FAR1-RELATED SEQUENCE 5-like [Bidens hawaiensis]|uniref:protein FAR1-RELATED SEQUENCE 5-like n=1 Tax=Bidens hawaiensis TaxID=980011 RepID=UPI00404A4A91
MRTKYGGFEKVGATKDDCKNFKQSLTCYIGEYDAEMVVQRLSGKKNWWDGYSFEYTVNTNGELDHLFWADEISKKNYLDFGDIISFDATFKTNKYIWFLYHLLPLIITVVILHWCCPLYNEDFKRKICDIVWMDAISQSEFETQWELIMKEYDIETNKWLCDMFEMRYDWIPAYYMDEPLSGLMRTTSRSESENHFYCQVSNSQLSLVEFFSHFDRCMEIQRHNGRKNDHDTRYTHPDLVSENPFEKEAELMYTMAIFNDFQDEMYHIRSGVACLKLTEEEDFVRFSIFDFNAYVPGCLEVLFKKEGEEGIDSTISCG